MPNTIALISIFNTMFDEVMVTASTTSWMEANAGMVKYNGGNKIEIPSISSNGLGDYSRDTGYAKKGATTISYETHTFDKDRSQTYVIDSMDIDESGFVAQASAIMSDVARTQVAPEIDSYRHAKLFEIANTNLKTGNYVPDSTTIFNTLTTDISNIKDVIGSDYQLVVIMSERVGTLLDQADKIEKRLDVTNFANGQIVTAVKGIDGTPILRVPSSRFKTLYDFSATAGYSANANAMDINWIIVARQAPVAIVKQNITRFFTPEQNQDADGWKMPARVYHTLIMPKNKVDSLYVSYKSKVAPALTTTVAKVTGTGNTGFTATVTAESTNVLGYTLTATADSGFQNTIPTITKPYTSATAIAATIGQYLNMYEVTAAGRVVKFASHKLVTADIT